MILRVSIITKIRFKSQPWCRHCPCPRAGFVPSVECLHQGERDGKIPILEADFDD